MNKFISMLLALIMLFAVNAYAEPEQAELPVIDRSVISNEIPDGFEFISENDSLALYAEFDSGKIAVHVKKSGYNWFSNPVDSEYEDLAGGELKKRLDSQLVMYYTQGYSEAIVSSATGVVRRRGLSHKLIENGIRFDYDFKQVGYTIPVQYYLTDDGLRAECLVNEITPELVTKQEKVSGSEKMQNIDYNITRIDFLQYFGAGNLYKDGYMLIPEGSGGIIKYNNGKTNYSSYEAPIYGQYLDIPAQRNLSNNLVRLPVYGVSHGENAFVAIIDENESIGSINAMVAGRETTFNTVYPSIRNKIVDFTAGANRTQPLSETLAVEGSFSMLLKFLCGNDANYSGMAAAYRQHLVENEGITAKESAKKNPLYLEFYSGVERETSVFGIVRRVNDVLTSYDDVAEVISDFNSEGISDLVIKYNGWTKQSQRKKIKSKVSYDRALGGKKGFNAMLSVAETAGAVLCPSMNFVEYSSSSMGYNSIFDASKSPDQSPAYQRALLRTEGEFGKRWSLLKPNKVFEAANSFLESYQKTDATGIALEVIGSKIYSDNTKNGVKRSQTEEIWSDIVDSYKEKYDNVMVSDANAYAFAGSDYIIGAPINEYGNELIDIRVPFYQMVLHGLVSYSTPAVNLTSDWENTVLRAVETGSALSFTLVKENSEVLKSSYFDSLYSCDYNTWRDKIVAEYKRLWEYGKKTAGLLMTGHSELLDGVFMTEYEDGTKTVVNYNGYIVNTEYGEVGASDFIVTR